MNYLEKEVITKKGSFIKESRIDRYRVRQYYLYNGNEHFIDIFSPSEFATRNSSGNELKQVKQSIERKEKQTMSKLNLSGKGNAEKSSKLSLSKKSETKPGMTLEGITAVKELKEMINGKFNAIESMLKQQGEKLEKLYDVSFNNNNDQIITLLTELVNVTKQGKPVAQETKKAESKTETKDNEVSEGAYKTFLKLYGKELPEENFDYAMKADFTNFETMEESLKELEREWKDKGKGFIVARRSSKDFKQALWETAQKEVKGTKKDNKAPSPAYDTNYFSKSLNVPKQAITEIIKQVNDLDVFDEDVELEIMEYLEGEGMELKTKEKEFDEFIEWLKADF